jgi:hypothetical protein
MTGVTRYTGKFRDVPARLLVARPRMNTDENANVKNRSHDGKKLQCLNYKKNKNRFSKVTMGQRASFGVRHVRQDRVADTMPTLILVFMGRLNALEDSVLPRLENRFRRLRSLASSDSSLGIGTPGVARYSTGVLPPERKEGAYFAPSFP